MFSLRGGFRNCAGSGDEFLAGKSGNILRARSVLFHCNFTELWNKKQKQLSPVASDHAFNGKTPSFLLLQNVVCYFIYQDNISVADECYYGEGLAKSRSVHLGLR